MDREITNPALSEKLQKLSGETFVGNLISVVISLFLIIASIASLFLLIIGGLQWMTSGGDKAATETARGRITAALIGLVIVFSVWAIMKVIETILGITIISGPITLPSL